MIISQYPAAGTIQNIGLVNVVITAMDECGNTNDCNFDVNITTTVGISESTRVEISIYPNPNRGLFNLDLGSLGNQNFSVKIYSLTGQVVYNKETGNGNNNYNLNLQHVEKGIYFVSIKTETNTIIKKIIIM
jgi:citrate lyase gamma subunit